MKKILSHMLNKVPILKYILSSLVKWFIIAALFCGILYAVLSLTGYYAMMETVLNLRYNSPFVLVPLLAFAALAILCFVIGFLLYFHKYKRPAVKSKFYRALSTLLNDRRKNAGEQGDTDK